MKIEESRLAVLFKNIAAAVDRGHVETALRFADTARRFAPSNVEAILLHSRLLLRVGDAEAAACAVRGQTDPECVVLHAGAACQAGWVEEAHAAASSLLSKYAVDAFDELVPTAAALCRAHPDQFPGWVGFDAALNLVGEISTDGIVSFVQNGASLGQLEVRGAEASPVPFTFSPPPGHLGPIRVHIGSRELLGSRLHWPPDCTHCGWVVLEDRQLAGEVSLPWSPKAPVRLVVSEGSGERRFLVEAVHRGTIGWVFGLPLDDSKVEGGSELRAAGDGADVHVAALLADGRRVPLAGSPLKPQPVSPQPIARGQRPAVPAPAASPPAINVVVPVYGGLHETLNCLRSVLATVPAHAAVVTVVDDASPEPALREALDELARTGRITLLRNPLNLGFPGAANRGIRLHPRHDVVLLNSDTEVFEGWLERLRAVAYSAGDIGTVTPLGEAASITSYGLARKTPYTSAEAAEIDRVAREVNGTNSVDIPVGVGFCLYMRRSCLDEAGEFDEIAFAKGYGEENDLCLRARSIGWRHVAATGLFVRHLGGRSYGEAKRVLSTRNSRVINYRHPGYDRLVAEFIAADPLRAARRAIDGRRLLQAAARPTLILSFDLPGGVKRHVEQREAELATAGHTVLVLRAESSRPPRRARVELAVAGAEFEHLVYDLPRELPEIHALLRELRLIQVELHHFLGLPDEILEMVESLHVPYRVYVHDYAWICPRVSLVSGGGVYCGEPAIEACEACVSEHGSAFPEPITVAELRRRSGRILGGAERVVAPTRDVRDRLARYFPRLEIAVTPWETQAAPAHRPARTRYGRLRVGLIGAIGGPKGYGVLLACARDAAARDLPIEFVVIGYTREDGALLETGRVFVTGPYEEAEAAELLERESCDLVLFPSQTPETWCYTLSYALAKSLPIVAFDLGAVAERLRAAGTGLLLPSTTAPAALNDALLAQAAATESPINPFDRSKRSAMPQNQSSETVQGPPELSATVQVLELPVGIYAFTVKGGEVPAIGGIAVPALQIAPAPAHHTGSVEFMQGPGTLDRWLTRPGDVVTVKISGGSVALLLTSLRTEQSPALAIDVRRLDVAESSGPTPSAAQAAEAVDDGRVKTRALLHLLKLGDVEFTGDVAGRLDENLWVEAFSVVAREPGLEDLLEYRGVPYQGADSGWLSGGTLCGSRGTATPLLEFAVRVRDAQADRYECDYSGKFLSGSIVGPLSGGSACRSESPDDPLVAIELRVQKRPAADITAAV